MSSNSEAKQPQSATVSFKCTKCGCQNEAPIQQTELLFGGGGAMEDMQRPISAVGVVRSFIVRCRKCNVANRISVHTGQP